jgi:hypothetical protein
MIAKPSGTHSQSEAGIRLVIKQTLRVAECIEQDLARLWRTMCRRRLPGGFGGNATSINRNVPALSRFIFDGNGNVLGASAGSNANAPTYAAVGVYAVASNCTAAITLNTGQHYNAVIVDQGNQVLFVQSDAKGNGAAGTTGATGTTATPTSGLVSLQPTTGQVISGVVISQ